MESIKKSNFIPSTPSEARWLRLVARAWGIQPSYRSISGETVWASAEAVLTTLENLSGESINDLHSLKAVYRKKAELLKRSLLQPVQVGFSGQRAMIRLYLNPYTELHPVFLTVSLEEGGSHIEEIPVENLSTRSTEKFLRVDVPLKENLPLGYHDIKVSMGAQRGSALFVSAPLRTSKLDKKTWGAFFPLYGLKSSASWGVGSLGELHQAWNLMHSQGADWVGTLPMLASNLEHENCDPSPYSALTRLFWNEVYLDVDALLKQYDVPEILEYSKSSEIQSERERLQELPEVDYHASYALKKKILIRLSEHFFDEGLDESSAFEEFTSEYPEVWDYATFRSDDSREQRYHVFCQFQMSRSLHRLCDDHKANLYLDYPVGVSESGFDNFQFKELFLNSVSVGAPPDPLAEQGQNWGFAALKSDELQNTKYSYLRRSLQNHFRFCRILRIDHIMGFHRLYVIPKGHSGKDGLYLKYPAREWFAVACLEAQRAGADIIGEDLGTVPDAVRDLLQKHDINGMWILEMEAPQASWSRREPPSASLSGFNTHDMPTFRAFLEGHDLKLMEKIGMIPEGRAEPLFQERRQQMNNWKDSELENADFAADDSEQMLVRCLEYLCGSNSRYVLVNVEDLWGETNPQNVPGTWKEYPNWRKKLALPVDQWREHALFNRALEILRRRS